jgi:alkylated DNA repair dioxygenase AlkB
MKRARTVTNSAFTTCPICGSSIPLFRADEHVASCLNKEQDSEPMEPKRKPAKEFEEKAKKPELRASSSVSSHQQKASTSKQPTHMHGIFQARGASSSWPIKLKDGTVVIATPHKKLGGQWLFEDFVSEAEESELLKTVDKGKPPSWEARSGEKANGHHLVKAWGVKPDYYVNTVSPAVHPMPPWLLALAERMRGGLPLMSRFSPNEANAVKYVRDEGHWLKAHADHRSMSAEVIVNLSLGGAATMTFGSTKNGSEHRVLLPRRSLQVMSGDARYANTHAINKEDFHEPLRISITFRYSPITHP